MYTPNFNDPRVIKRCLKAVGFAQARLRSSASSRKDNGQPLSTRLIDKHFGMATNPLSKYLRATLLHTTNERYNKDTGQCKEYIYSASGMRHLADFITVTDNTALDWATETYNDELSTLNFEYIEKSHRLFNPIQNIKSETRTTLLANHGLKYQYDVVCCAPILLYHYTFFVPGVTGEVLETIEDYIQNRSRVRNQLASDLEVSTDVIKKFINALFNGARVTTSLFGSATVMTLFDNDIAKVEMIKQHDYIIALRKDIWTLWDTIKSALEVEYITDKNGNRRKRALNSKMRWNVYFQLERQYINSCRDYMDMTNIKYFLIHDGWATDKKIDVDDMSRYVRDITGFGNIIDIQVEESLVR